MTSDAQTGLSWKASNTAVTMVNRNGKVTARARGKAVITVSTYNGKTAKVTVSVK